MMGCVLDCYWFDGAWRCRITWITPGQKFAQRRQYCQIDSSGTGPAAELPARMMAVLGRALKEFKKA